MWYSAHIFAALILSSTSTPSNTHCNMRRHMRDKLGRTRKGNRDARVLQLASISHRMIGFRSETGRGIYYST